MGCIFVFFIFWLYWIVFDIGVLDGSYKVLYVVIFREMVILGVEGFLELFKYCFVMFCGFFVVVFVINLFRDVILNKVSRFIFVLMAMVVSFYIGVYFVIDMFVGIVILFVWE